MALPSAYEKYNNSKVMTASPAELTLMLYDGAIKFSNIAIMAIEENNIEKANIKSVYYAEKDLNDVLHTVLQCLSHISDKKYYGVSVLVDVLRGSQSKKIIDAGLNRITEYASLKEIDRESLVAIIFVLPSL